MFVISGVTGHTGSVVAQSLIDRGHPVRVIVRSEAKGESWKAKGAEVAIADIMDVDAMTNAYRVRPAPISCCRRIWPNAAFIDESLERAASIVAAAGGEDATCGSLSSVGAQHEERVGPIAAVARLEGLTSRGRDPADGGAARILSGEYQGCRSGRRPRRRLPKHGSAARFQDRYGGDTGHRRSDRRRAGQSGRPSAHRVMELKGPTSTRRKTLQPLFPKNSVAWSYPLPCRRNTGLVN